MQHDTMSNMQKTLPFLAAIVVITACGGQDNRQTVADTGVGMTATPAATPATQTVTDPQIAAIVVAANNVDIEAGRMAAARSTNPRVREFAERMITDHGGVNKAATDLVTRLGVTPEESDVSRQLTQSGEQSRNRLQGMSGAEFDRAYIANEVTYHQELLDAIDQLLLPSAQNAELRGLLEQTRPAVVSHLQAAQQLQTSLGQG